MAKFKKYEKSEYRKAFEYVDRLVSYFSKYDPKTAKQVVPENYMSFSEAIADRDFPMTRLEVICLLKKITDQWPSYFEVNKARPDDDDFVQKIRREELADYNYHYGESL